MNSLNKEYCIEKQPNSDTCLVYTDSITVENHQTYSMRGYWNDHDYLYLSYETKSGWCRQIYEQAYDSKFEFIIANTDKNRWYIKNKLNDKQLDKWLSYGPCKDRKGEMVGLWSDVQHRAIWELIPQQTAMHFKIKCYYEDKFRGWLSFQWDGRWNKLYEDEKDASVYKLEKNTMTDLRVSLL